MASSRRSDMAHIVQLKDLSPKFKSASEVYLERGDDRYFELAENFRVPQDVMRDPADVSRKVKRYLVIFVSKEFARDRIGTDINQGIDGQVVDHYQNIFDVYDSEENERLQELSAYDFLTDDHRSDVNDYSTSSIELRRS
jgi:hypothetical protein